MPQKDHRFFDRKPLLNLPNTLSVLRLFLVPAFIALMLRFRATADQNFYLASLAVFAVAAVTDALDGFIASTRKE